MAFAHRLAQVLAAADTRLKVAAQKAVALFREDRTQFADTYVQPRELRYTLAEVLGLVKGASLDLVNFVHEREWDPAAYLDDPALLTRLQSLTREDRWRFCDATGSPFYHFLCAHPAAASPRPRPCLADDGLMLDIDRRDPTRNKVMGYSPAGKARAAAPKAATVAVTSGKKAWEK